MLPHTRFCNYESVIILLVFSFSPGAKLSVKHRHSAVLQLHLHTQPRGRPPTHKRVPSHTHTHARTPFRNQPRWLVPLTLTLIETLCTKACQCSATVVMMDQQSKSDVEKDSVMHPRGRSCVKGTQCPRMTPKKKGMPGRCERPAAARGYTMSLSHHAQIRHFDRNI